MRPLAPEPCLPQPKRKGNPHPLQLARSPAGKQAYETLPLPGREVEPGQGTGQEQEHRPLLTRKKD